MIEVDKLLGVWTPLCEMIDCANNIINTHELSLTEEEVSRTFLLARMSIARGNKNLYRNKYRFLFNNLLKNNKDMFIAIVKARYDPYINVGNAVSLVCNVIPFRIGFVHSSDSNIIRKYKALLNYGDFDIDILDIPNSCKLEIQKYRDDKYYKENLTKPAIKI